MGRYDDIINLPHPISRKHKPMAMKDRAAQFAPFAALTGYDDAIAETARLTDQRIELTEGEKSELDLRLMEIAGRLAALQRELESRDILDRRGIDTEQLPEVTVTYFQPDLLKEGGSYEEISGRVKKIDTVQKLLFLADGKRIAIENIYALALTDMDYESW